MDKKILIVDDEESICEILQYNLELEGYSVNVVSSAEEALRQNIKSYSLIILDIMMKNMNGYELAKKLKSDPETEFTPIIFCSALNSEDARIKGLNIGGDDYIVKPFRIREVLARVRSLLRRADMIRKFDNSHQPVSPEESDIEFLGLRIFRKNKQCLINDEPIRLTKTEFELLVFFLSNPNCIYTRKEIISNIWGRKDEVTERAIDTNITRLRKKIGEYGNYLTTRLGYGYGFQKKLEK
ncbi:MAG: response regulator transcription factor [Muribaculaceae bacterium]